MDQYRLLCLSIQPSFMATSVIMCKLFNQILAILTCLLASLPTTIYTTVSSLLLGLEGHKVSRNENVSPSFSHTIQDELSDVALELDFLHNGNNCWFTDWFKKKKDVGICLGLLDQILYKLAVLMHTTDLYVMIPF